jgi:hypothetical protein
LETAGLVDLDHYLAGLAAPWPQDLSPAARKAALLNAYNCLTIRCIITNYPVASVWRTRHPFTEVRHRIDNRAVSLDAIETELAIWAILESMPRWFVQPEAVPR